MAVAAAVEEKSVTVMSVTVTATAMVTAMVMSMLHYRSTLMVQPAVDTMIISRCQEADRGAQVVSPCKQVSVVV